MSRVKGGKGYLLIDDRASGGKKLERATLTCAHCQMIVVLNPARVRARSYCRKCDAYLCDSVGCNALCTPIMQSLDLARSYPGLPVLVRGKQGELLCDPSYFDRRIF